jgi:diaminopimelate epimerase
LRFYKVTGSGNDFIFLDGRENNLTDWPPKRIREICARRSGVGADGLVILEPGSGGVELDGPRRVRFHYFNADGNRSDMCGNASLCASRLAVRLGLAEPGGMILETDIGEVAARSIDGPGERAEIEMPDVDKPLEPNISRIEGERWMRLFVAGVPHLIVRVDDVDAPTADPADRGRYLRSIDVLQPSGANVNFIAPLADGSWRYRTFERGVEAETLACGTGAVAVTAAIRMMEPRECASAASDAQQTVTLQTTSGCLVQVTGTSVSDGSFRRPRLEGEGRLVFVGDLGPGI